ncbi:ABC transporter ATP-binding protein [Sulfitobacter donghicola]|uniref:ABC transporter ATP-binding protein n=1 Tax=Sulfitobacter donghicola DSW-25 = KCTC 12864 = JCM 14565 TaxID=1300350 RepID=A0A073IEM2_9RHOB|nr:ABC transporter ATP-binding protein [Sulfitobacter donghicola]KEJ88199.1 ABC transporter ATP-binding protein [Sulfitobacter donghicola DSW-25 = KCTC 12864 = JCM 14565]KIN68791.1 ABC transporter, ATPase subunit [Sulfitobacter donghicola DSW-25 = KCTC 12864 = JCM 14565]
MLLSVKSLKKSYSTAQGNVPVLKGIDMHVNAGDTLALTGESGSGKSTLLHLIGGLDLADEGQIILDGRDVTHLDDAGRAALRRHSIGIIFQQFNLIPSLDVAANIAFQARLSGVYNPAEAAKLAAALGLGDQLSKYPDQLSGGQQQRVAIARALAVKPKLILADEPTGNLDEDTASDVMAQMLSLVAQTGAALVMVTHSPRLAGQMSRQLNLRQGLLA